RINQKGAWSAWNRIVNSYLLNAPSATETKIYEQILNPVVTYAGDDQILLSIDIMSFDWADDRSSWILLDSVKLEEVTITP
ncbi:MAG: hypothetical protein N2246_11710, partial [Candidatus Sumerlaeia bacterium]|nr:hypothetical protein [Candidatus Sumerlaeia bacterium]